ncbi:endonuclease/exonuclease/phosphatase family protein [Mesorhizobium sp. M00.F.Ca.ET.216.01.1.1]|uniref:endonuclease/exonuclease/phosphatase family protein n=1 Tax=Mesorhizobium sp. M00.F.Ca.ET.216.01.1.1 TaxID=2500528 RepID=UPI001FDFDA20|nr:endonuclease/exonuclease/phosphatase family protein [Mesorhizobium sp. M00.F.Ca.ET.216.01.1.1]
MPGIVGKRALAGSPRQDLTSSNRIEMLNQPPTLSTSVAAALRQKAPRLIELNGDPGSITIASYNVHKCVGTDGLFDPLRVAKVVREIDADIIALQEVDERTGKRQGLLDLEALRQETDLVAAHTPDNLRSHGWHGNMILARKGIVQAVSQVRLPGLEPRGALIADLEIGGVVLRIIAAHFGLLRRSRTKQAGALLEATHPVLRPTILLGDLNEWRVRNRSSLLALLPHFGPIHVVLPSFPSRFPLLALDRILAKPPTLISRIEVHQTPLSRIASDHLPIKARLNLNGIRHLHVQPDFSLSDKTDIRPGDQV